MHVIVLGSAAGGGFPQWNCRCPVCCLAWAHDPRVAPRTQSCVAVSAGGEKWLLLNASPDLRQQILATPRLMPRHGARDSPISGVLLTNGDVDHLAGLLTLRERQALTIYGSPAILDMLEQNAIFGVLDINLVRRIPFGIGAAIGVDGLTIRPFAVPGKVPLFLEGDSVEIGQETDMTLGLDIAAGGRRVVYVPGCARVTPQLLDQMAGADVLFFDGTTYTDDEMVRLGLSPKTATRMGHLAMSGAEGSLAALARARVGRKVYTHINNTNPALIEGSPERRAVEAAGWEMAYDGLEIAL